MQGKLWSELLPDYHEFRATEDDAEELRAHATKLAQKNEIGTGGLIESIQSLSIVNTAEESEKTDDGKLESTQSCANFREPKTEVVDRYSA